MPFATSTSLSRVASNDPSRFFSPEPERHIKDIIYDLVPIARYLSCFIDTKPFQRLRNVKQLGTTCYVWPSASHSRFEHCLGVAYLARCLASHLQKSQPELKISDRDVACVEIAGLCHDLGHGPWSHVWDGIFMKEAIPDSNWCHEDGSAMMFDYIIKTYNIPMSEKDVSFVKALISGDKGHCSPDERPFLFEIVANKRNGIDVDKFDYIQRDSRMLGESMSISLTRILKSARVIGDEICYNIKDADSIHNICVARFRLHKAFYNHKSAKAIEYMIVDALRSADPYLKISERVFDPEKFMHLSDVIMNSVEESTAPELATARKIFTRIRERDLYRCVDYKVVDWELRNVFKKFITPARIVEASRSIPRSAFPVPTATEVGDIELEQIDENIVDDAPEDSKFLKADDIVVDFATMHHGMHEKLPLDSVKFYSKNKPNESMHAGPGVYSGLLPRIFAEVMLRIYTKKSKFYGLVQAGFRTLLEEMERTIGPDGTPLDVAQAPTPPASSVGDTDIERDMSKSIENIQPLLANPSTPPTTTQPLPETPKASEAAPEGKKRTFSRTTSASFQGNPFTRVAHDFAPPSPSTRAGGSGKPPSKRRSVGHLGVTQPEFSPLLEPSPLIMGEEPSVSGNSEFVVAAMLENLKGAKRVRDAEDENAVFVDKKRKA